MCVKQIKYSYSWYLVHELVELMSAWAFVSLYRQSQGGEKESNQPITPFNSRAN